MALNGGFEDVFRKSEAEESLKRQMEETPLLLSRGAALTAEEAERLEEDHLRSEREEDREVR